MHGGLCRESSSFSDICSDIHAYLVQFISSFVSTHEYLTFRRDIEATEKGFDFYNVQICFFIEKIKNINELRFSTGL